MIHLHDNVLPAGTQIGVYEIKDVINIGTFDITYRAWNHHLKEAVKIQEYFPYACAKRANNGLGTELKSESDKENFEYGLKIFLDQAEALMQIEHPNIVATENVLQFNGTAYLVMARQKGVSLSKLVESQTVLPETELRFILISILAASQEIHAHKIIHGGIQPGAIVLGKDGEPQLTDFSAARLAVAARNDQLAETLATGYAPVEQYEFENANGPATDFYSLGATIYYCMTHQQPVAARPRKMALDKGESDPMGLLSTASKTTYSAELLQAVNWMLQPEYRQRPQSALELLTLLESGHSDDQSESFASKQAATETGSHRKYLLVAGVIAGIIALGAVMLRFDDKAVEVLVDKSDMAVAPSIPEQTIATSKSTQTQTQTQTQTAAVVSIDSDAESVSEEMTGARQESMNDAAKQLAKNERSVENSPLVATIVPEINQQAIIDQSLSQPEQSNNQAERVDAEFNKKYLSAAARALKAERLTTPMRDNAHKYYRAVLAVDSDNEEALAGLQKIVDRYIQFIDKAKAAGKLNEANLYLHRAESVLPGDPELQNIRAELLAITTTSE